MEVKGLILQVCGPGEGLEILVNIFDASEVNFNTSGFNDIF